MNCQVYLVRHGAVSNPNAVVYADLPGFHLSAAGVLAVHRTAKHMSDFEMDIVVTSPLIRAVETAVAIADRHDLAPVVDSRLTESGQFPHWTGHRWDSIPRLFPREFNAYIENALQAGGDESPDQIADRLVEAIDEAIEQGHNNIVVVSHQDPIQATRIRLTGGDLAGLRVNPPSHAEVTTLTGTVGGTWTETSRWHPPTADTTTSP